MDKHCFRVLEFNKICEFLQTFARSDGGKKLSLNLVPENEGSAVSLLLEQTTQLRDIIENHGKLPLNSIHDISNPVNKTRIPNFILDPKNLLDIKDTLETADIIKQFLSGFTETHPVIAELGIQIIPLKHIVSSIQKCISSQGDILDNASPELYEIRNRLKKLRLKIINILEQTIQDHEINYAVQDDFITIRNNRYVIPVRADSKSTIPGIVHDQSQTKATIFIEPLPVVAINNDLQMLKKEEYYEELKILRSLTGLIKSQCNSIIENLDRLHVIDLIHAKALFGIALNGIEPLLSDSGQIDLKGCRHPILLARFVENTQNIKDTDKEPPENIGQWVFNSEGTVPVNLVRNPETSVLVITGANAGGKTVAMKTIGLFILMTQSGLHIPVDKGSVVSVFGTVFADIGDEQNISSNMSTFSAHMEQIKKIVSTVSPSSIVLLDELGTGTDPGEGGALASAILDYLRQQRCFTVVTTHLNILKTYAYHNSDVENVSVCFDPETYRPTYHLAYGVPGISNAIAIARNVGILPEILEKAQSYTDPCEQHIGELIHGLEKTHIQLSNEKNSVLKLKKSLKALHSESEKLHSLMRSQKDIFLKDFRNKAMKFIRESEDKLERIIKDQKKTILIRPDDSRKITENAKKEFRKVKDKVQEHFPVQREQGKPLTDLETGQQVFVTALQRTGTVASYNPGTRKAEIIIGQLKINASIDELEMCTTQSQKPEDKNKIKKSGNNATAKKAVEEYSTKINIIGLRSADAIPVVEKAVDGALMQGAASVEIVHGRGTGRLMHAVHEYLKENPSVKGFSHPDETSGGTGITIAYIIE